MNGLLLSWDMPMVVVVGRRVRYSELFSRSLDVTYCMTSSSSYPSSTSSATVVILRWPMIAAVSIDSALRSIKNSSSGMAWIFTLPSLISRLTVTSNSCGTGWGIICPVIGSGMAMPGSASGSSYCSTTVTPALSSDMITIRVISSRPVYFSTRILVFSSHQVLTTPHLRTSESLSVE